MAKDSPAKSASGVELVSGAYIEHEGQEYNYGDPVPQSLADAHPEAVIEKPLSEKDIDKMTKDELQTHLKRVSGHVTVTPSNTQEVK